MGYFNVKLMDRGIYSGQPEKLFPPLVEILPCFLGLELLVSSNSSVFLVLQILPCFSIWTKFPLPQGGGNGQNIYPWIGHYTIWHTYCKKGMFKPGTWSIAVGLRLNLKLTSCERYYKWSQACFLVIYIIIL